MHIRLLIYICVAVSFYNTCYALNLVNNPGFEFGKENQISDWNIIYKMKENSIERVKNFVHSGKYAVKLTAIEAEDPGKSVSLYTNLLKVPENSLIDLFAWIKAKDIVSNGSYYHGRIVLSYYDSGKNRLLHRDLQINGSSEGWTKIKIAKITPQKTKYMRLTFCLTSCTGSMWIDDVELKVAQPAPTFSTAEIIEPVIIPNPWKTKYSKRSFELGSIAVVMDPVHGKQPYLLEEIEEFFLKAGISEFGFHGFGEGEINEYDTQLVFGDFDHTDDLIHQFRQKFPENAFNELGNQGYILSVDDTKFQNRIFIGGNNEQARFYGFQTLKQSLCIESNPKVYILDIIDAPTLEKRGIAMGVQWFADSIEAISRLASLKGNIVINQGSFLNFKFLTKWRSLFTINELVILKNYLSQCRKHFIEPQLNFGPRSVNPDVDPVQYSSDKEIETLSKKIKQLYAIGFRNFGINFDDLKNVNQERLITDADKEVFEDNVGKAHSYFVLSVYRRLKTTCPDIEFSVLPMYYGENSNITDLQQQYLSSFASLPPEIEIIASAESKRSTLEFNSLVQRKINLWSNFFTTFEPSKSSRTSMWPYLMNLTWDNNVKSAIDSVCFLPLVPAREDYTLVSWKTAFDYMWAPERYDYQQAYNRAMSQGRWARKN